MRVRVSLDFDLLELILMVFFVLMDTIALWVLIGDQKADEWMKYAVVLAGILLIIVLAAKYLRGIRKQNP